MQANYSIDSAPSGNMKVRAQVRNGKLYNGCKRQVCVSYTNRVVADANSAPKGNCRLSPNVACVRHQLARDTRPLRCLGRQSRPDVPELSNRLRHIDTPNQCRALDYQAVIRVIFGDRTNTTMSPELLRRRFVAATGFDFFGITSSRDSHRPRGPVQAHEC
jgi:hypothetical protein